MSNGEGFLWWVGAFAVFALTLGTMLLQAEPDKPKPPFTAYQSGGNCVYIVDGKYAKFISVVPVGQGGC